MHDHYFSINPIRLFMWVVGRSLWRSLVFALSFGLFANRAQISLGGYCIVRGGERGEASASPTPPMPGHRDEVEGLYPALFCVDKHKTKQVTKDPAKSTSFFQHLFL